MGLGNVADNHSVLTETKFGNSPVGSYASYQLSFTESNFDVSINIDAVLRNMPRNQQIEQFPSFTLWKQGEGERRELPDEKNEFVKKFNLDEDEINALQAATRDQANSELWRSERKYRFTAVSYTHLTLPTIYSV